MLHALKYAADGFAVFPVYEPTGIGVCSCGRIGCKGKHPRTPNGCSDATTDTETIKRWWGRWPNASIGIATGKASSVSVVDLDGLEGIMSGRRLGLQSAVTALTGSGEQLYYADPNGLLNNSVKKVAAGIDIRGNGGYVVVPPSLHPNGKRYSWRTRPLCRTALPPLPRLEEQNSASSTLTSTIRKPDGWIAAALEEMRKGHVSNTLVSVLGKFRHHNFSEDDTYKLLQPYALLDGRPFKGLRDKITEIWQRYPQNTLNSGISRAESIDDFLKDVKEVEWICKPFIAKKSIGFVVGLPETLKTWFCVDLAVESVRDSGLWAGLFPVTSCRTLFVEQERARDETQNRFDRVLAAKNLQQTDLRGKLFIQAGTTIRLNLDASFQAFRGELAELRPDLVIFDSFRTAHSASENDSMEMQKVGERIKALRNEFNCAFLFIHHENKNAYPNGEPQGEPNLGTMAGSGVLSGFAEACMIVRKVEDFNSIVWHAKSTQGKKSKPFYVSIADVLGGIAVRGMND